MCKFLMTRKESTSLNLNLNPVSAIFQHDFFKLSKKVSLHPEEEALSDAIENGVSPSQVGAKRYRPFIVTCKWESRFIPLTHSGGLLLKKGYWLVQIY
jgi:hypothetical protein